MRSILFLTIFGCSVLCVRTKGAGPDDAFISVYNQIQGADTLKDQGQLSDAYAGFLKAKEELARFQKSYPNWNDRIISYRIRFVDERLEALKEYAPAPAVLRRAAASPPSRQAAVVETGEVITEFRALTEQIVSLNTEKQLLEARLREALAAQPAPVNPRDLQRAVESITLLQSTNKMLMEKLQTQESERRNLVERVVVEELQRALSDSTKQLHIHKASSASLAKERDELEVHLKRLQERDLKTLKSENSVLKTQVSELKSDTERGRQIAELGARMGRLQLSLDSATRRNEELVAEKAALEKQLSDAQLRQAEEGVVRLAKLEGDLALARADADRSNARAEDLVFALEKEKVQRKRTEERNEALQRQNRELEQRMAALLDGTSGGTEIVRTLQAALDDERTQRTRLEAEIREMEGRVASGRLLTPSLGYASPGGGDPRFATLALPAIGGTTNVSDVVGLHHELAESRSREAELQSVLMEEKRLRTRLQAEMKLLEARLSGLGGRSSGPSTETMTQLERRVQELEDQRDALATQLARANEKAVTRQNVKIPSALTPRERAAEFRFER